jgi:hypothetical protein
MAREKLPYWVDHLAEKHECFSYGDAKTIAVEHNGRNLRVIVPEEAEDLIPLAVGEAGGLLTVVGRLEKNWNGRPLGILLVAKKRAEDEYEVGVWHELYPWALRHFGFVSGISE